MSYRVELRIPGLTKLPNQLLRRNWRTVQAERARVHKLVWAALVERPGLKPAKPLDSARVTVIRRSSIQPDPDGLYGGAKYLIDALVAQGVIVDDSARHVELKCRWEREAPKRAHSVVIVEEIGR